MDSDESQAADADLAVAVAAGDRQALAAIFDRYAPRLLAFCQSMLHHRADAEDCLQDIFILTATRISGLREPDRLRSWLFAIARHECLRRLDRRTREVLVDAVPEERRPDRAAPAGDSPAGAALDNELAALLADAIAGLADRDRLVLDLADRQGLATDEVAAALSMSPGSAYKLLTRARATARRSIGALLVARTGRDHCTELNALLGNWNGSMTPLLRKRVARHIEDCSLCQEQEKRVASPAALLGAGTAFAMPIPIGLRSHILDTAYEARSGSIVVPPSDPWNDGWPPKSSNIGGTRVFGGSGSHPSGPGSTGSGSERRRSGRRGPAVAVAAAVAVLLLIGAFVAIGRPSVSPQAIRGPLPAISVSPQAISSSTTPGSPTTDAGVPLVIGPTVVAPTEKSRPATIKSPAGSTGTKPRSTAAPSTTPGPATTSTASIPTGTTSTTSTSTASIPTGTTSTASTSTASTSTASSATSLTRSTISTARTSATTRTSSATSTPTTSRRTTSTTPTTTTAPNTAPQITGMSVLCQYSRSTGATVPLLTWTTTNTHDVALSIDNPGIVGSYGTGYPSSGQLELPPNGCDPAQGTQIYTLYALTSGQPTAQQTINWVPPAPAP